MIALGMLLSLLPTATYCAPAGCALAAIPVSVLR